MWSACPYQDAGSDSHEISGNVCTGRSRGAGAHIAGGRGRATITVDDSGGADYTRIQDAIDDAIISSLT